MFENMALSGQSEEKLPDKDLQDEKPSAPAKTAEDRYRFYTPKSNKANPDAPSKDWQDIRRRIMEAPDSKPLAYRIKKSTPAFETDTEAAFDERARSNVEKEREKSPEIIEELDQAKERLMDFTASIGVRRDQRHFIDNEDIYIRKKLSNEYVIPCENFTILGTCYPNEIEILDMKKEDAGSNPKIKEGTALIMQHELIHCLCTNRNYVERLLRLELGNGFGSSGREIFHAFNEGMTELTNLQVFLDNGLTPAGSSYINQVIFISMLSEDIARRLNITSSRVTNKPRPRRTGLLREKMMLRKEIFDPDMDDDEIFYTSKDVLAFLQRGMFNSDRRCLKLLSGIYGKEAVKALSKMGFEKEDVIKTARAFNPDGIGNDIVKRLEDYHAKKAIPFNIAGHGLTIASK